MLLGVRIVLHQRYEPTPTTPLSVGRRLPNRDFLGLENPEVINVYRRRLLDFRAYHSAINEENSLP